MLNKNTLSAIGTVVSPDGKASFQYPAVEIGLQGMELVEEFNTTINNKKYPTQKFEGNGLFLFLIEMGTDANKNGYNISYIYKSSEYKDDLEHILQTFKF